MAWWAVSSSVLCVCLMVLARTQDDIRVPPMIIEPLAVVPKVRFYEQGDKVILRCQATGQPDPKYQWTRNSAAIESDNVIMYDAIGILIIKNLTTREEGLYGCRAKNTFPNGMSAVAISSKIEVRVARIGSWQNRKETVITANQGDYTSIKCKNQPVYYGPTVFKWYAIDSEFDHEEYVEVIQDDRIFIDNKGTLHFTYVMASDEKVNRAYACALSSATSRRTELGGRTRLMVSTSRPMAEVQPALQYWTGQADKSDLTFACNTQGRLECVFSGFDGDLEGNTVPNITWKDDAGNIIVSGQDRYTIKNYGRVLLIHHLVEADEARYICVGTNEKGTAEKTMLLNVTSAPIWMNPLKSATVPQGEDAEFTCETRSASGEADSDPPRWFRNGQPFEETYDPNKYTFEDEKRRMIVRSVQKNKDIACFQCFVNNSVGEEFSQGCLNVILPVVITSQPEAEQSVEKGDIVNLTVVATSDLLYPLYYKWIFNKKTYRVNEAPPHVIYHPVSKVAYINTSYLTDDQLRDITGTYRQEIFNQFQTKYADVEITLKNESKGPDNKVDDDSRSIIIISTTAGLVFACISCVGVVSWFRNRRRTPTLTTLKTNPAEGVPLTRRDDAPRVPAALLHPQ